jgi:lipoyl(octanoyl) transferase
VERRQLGRVDFDRAWELQRELARDVTPDRGFLLLLEHPPVFTLGKNGNEANILDPHGIPVRRIDRGGDVTYHGPGQLVGYPIVDLRAIGVRRFIRTLEDSLLDLLAALGVRARRRGSSVGVWSSRGKIASIGVRVARGVSMHGFSLNVSNDLTPFGYIHPCGVVGGEVSSVSLELGRPVPVETAADRFRLRFWEAAVNS